MLTTILAVVAALFVGAAIGMLVMALCVAAKCGDRATAEAALSVLREYADDGDEKLRQAEAERDAWREDAEANRERMLKAEAENKRLQLHGHYTGDRTFCAACCVEIDECSTGHWYWHWHRVRDGRGSWYCKDCGPIFGTTNQDDVPYPCDCPDCTSIRKRRDAAMPVYLEALEFGPLCTQAEQKQMKAENEQLRPFADRATRNVEKWGLQDFETLGLAVCEEAGELAQAILQARHEDGDPARIAAEATDLGALCVQVLARYEQEHDK